jgi:hypothetical protein
MWEKIFQTILGRIAFALICFIGSGILLVAMGVWENNVASPEYVNQRVDERAEEIRVMLSLEDQEIKKELSKTKIQNSENQGKLMGKLEEMRKSFERANQGNAIFQTQVSSDLKYLKGSVTEIKEDQKETNQRLRQVESRNQAN